MVSAHSASVQTCFCVSMDHVRIVATVNVNSEASRAKMKAWFEKWQAERKRRKDAGEPQMVRLILGSLVSSLDMV